jgi:hypothetical protein
MVIRKIIHTDGTELTLYSVLSITEIANLLGADSLYIVDLCDNIHIMLFDDEAYTRPLPINITANALYKKKYPTKDYTIRGDVVIIPNRDLDRESSTA